MALFDVAWQSLNDAVLIDAILIEPILIAPILIDPYLTDAILIGLVLVEPVPTNIKRARSMHKDREQQ